MRYYLFIILFIIGCSNILYNHNDTMSMLVSKQMVMDKFGEPSELIKACRIKESPINFECQLRDILSYGDQPGCGSLVTGEVINVHISEEIFFDGKVDTDKFNPIGRGAGNDWIKCDSRIIKQRLMQTQIQK